MIGKLQGRIALITGASRGIGAAVAKRFALEGAHIVAVARTRGGLENTDDQIRAELGLTASAPSPVTLLELDLTELDSVDQIGPTLARRFGRLDIVVGNAGALGELSPMPHIEAADWKNVIDVNLNANWRLIRTTEPLLRKSDSGRAVYVTSGAARGKRPFWGGYAVSKAALEMMITCWAAENESTNIKINLIDPGATRTAMRKIAYPGEDPKSVKPPEDVTDTFLDLCSPECSRHGDRVQIY